MLGYKLYSVILVSIIVSTSGIKADDLVAPGLTDEQFRQGLAVNFTVYLNKLRNDAEARKTYIKDYYSYSGLEKRAAQLTPKELEAVKIESAMYQHKIVRDAVIKHELEARNLDIEALAKEKYEVNKEAYKTPRRIKIAQIYMVKKPGQEKDIEAKMQGLLKQLEEHNLQTQKQAEVAKEAGQSEADSKEIDLFADLAKQYSEDANAALGGFDSRWIIQPTELPNDPVIRGAFDLLRRGEITEVIEGKQGYHILRLMDYVPNQQQEFDQVKSQIIEKIKNDLWEQKDKDLALELKAPDDLQYNDALALKIIEEEYNNRSPELKQEAMPQNSVPTATSSAESPSATPVPVPANQ